MNIQPKTPFTTTSGRVGPLPSLEDYDRRPLRPEFYGSEESYAPWEYDVLAARLDRIIALWPPTPHPQRAGSHKGVR